MKKFDGITSIVISITFIGLVVAVGGLLTTISCSSKTCLKSKPKCEKVDKCVIRVNKNPFCGPQYDTVCNCTKEQYKGISEIEFYKEE